MLQILAQGRAVGLAVALMAAGAATAAAQDSAQAAPTDTSEAQNPPGYRGMERPANVFPPDPANGDSATAGQVEDRATGTYDDSTWQDTTGAQQNPAGYRGMGRSPDDSANADTTRAGKSKSTKKAARTSGDSTKWGYPIDSTADAQNPPGYRGMERPAGLPDSAGAGRTGDVEDRVTGTYDDSTWQDTSGAAQNPAGYRGMERPAGDSAVTDSATAGDTTDAQ